MRADKLGLRVIDLLKVDVEGSEEAVLRGIAPRHWPRIQQLVLEVENFATVAAITRTLTERGFSVRSYATEREKSPGATSEVSMMYAVRLGYAPGAPVLRGGAEQEAEEEEEGAAAAPAKQGGGARGRPAAAVAGAPARGRARSGSSRGAARAAGRGRSVAR